MAHTKDCRAWPPFPRAQVGEAGSRKDPCGSDDHSVPGGCDGLEQGVGTGVHFPVEHHLAVLTQNTDVHHAGMSINAAVEWMLLHKLLRQGITADDALAFTPELRQEALAILQKYHYGPLFTPPSAEQPTVVLPGVNGGASWAGAAFDPDTGWLYVPSITAPYTITLYRYIVAAVGGAHVPAELIALRLP